MDEFVALSDERLDEIRIAHASTIFGGHPKHRRGALTNALLHVAREASENTKRWLMTLVCGYCGDENPGLVMEEGADGQPIYTCSCSTLIREEDIVTRAEYLSRTEGR